MGAYYPLYQGAIRSLLIKIDMMDFMVPELEIFGEKTKSIDLKSDQTRSASISSKLPLVELSAPDATLALWAHSKLEMGISTLIKKKFLSSDERLHFFVKVYHL